MWTLNAEGGVRSRLTKFLADHSLAWFSLALRVFLLSPAEKDDRNINFPVGRIKPPNTSENTSFILMLSTNINDLGNEKRQMWTGQVWPIFLINERFWWIFLMKSFKEVISLLSACTPFLSQSSLTRWLSASDFLKMILFIYFWLCWVFVVARAFL